MTLDSFLISFTLFYQIFVSCSFFWSNCTINRGHTKNVTVQSAVQITGWPQLNSTLPEKSVFLGKQRKQGSGDRNLDCQSVGLSVRHWIISTNNRSIAMTFFACIRVPKRIKMYWLCGFFAFIQVHQQVKRCNYPVKHLNIYWMEWHRILYRHSWFQEDVSYLA